MLPFQGAIRLNENPAKLKQLKEDQEECEQRLEKERDIYTSNMFDLLAEEDNISTYILNYVKCKFNWIQLCWKTNNDIDDESKLIFNWLFIV